MVTSPWIKRVEQVLLCHHASTSIICFKLSKKRKYFSSSRRYHSPNSLYQHVVLLFSLVLTLTFCAVLTLTFSLSMPHDLSLCQLEHLNIPLSHKMSASFEPDSVPGQRVVLLFSVVLTLCFLCRTTIFQCLSPRFPCFYGPRRYHSIAPYRSVERLLLTRSSTQLASGSGKKTHRQFIPH